jgi:integrative and conjugative element protein (TIGR02256 family)
MRIWISVADEHFLTSEAVRHDPQETGGVLVGYRGEGGDLVVTAAVGPGPNARHGAFTFVPDHEFQEAEIARLYEQSGRRVIYLGDWHSHPRGSCSPSLMDRRTLRGIARDPDARIPEPLMVIIAGSPGSWRICAYQMYKKRFFWRIRRLDVQTVAVTPS